MDDRAAEGRDEALDGVREYVERRRKEIDSSEGLTARKDFWRDMVQRLDPESIGVLITLKEMNEERDGLTGVLNRRGLERALTEAMEWSAREKGPLTVVFIDLDRFKLFNDTYGHEVGDTVLERWVGFLQEGIRKTDAIGRYGGEEVVVLLRNATEEQGVLLFDRLREDMSVALGACLLGFGIHDPVTMSVGVAQRREAEGPEELIKRADARMYEAKLGGRNLVIGGTSRTA